MIPYLAHYRIEAIELVAERLKLNEFDLEILSGQNRMKKSIPCAEVQGCAMTLLESKQYKFFGANIGCQEGLIRNLKSANPAGVVCLFIPGHLGHVIALLYLLRNKIPYLLWGSAYERLEAGWITRIIRRPIRRFFLDRAAGHICYGEDLRQELIERGIPEQRIWVAQNTVNVERIARESSVATQADARRHSGIDEHAIVCLFVGALIPPKNLNALIRAFPRAADKIPELRLFIVGDGIDRAELEELRQDLGIEDEIVFTGAKYGAELEHIFNAADIFIMPGTGGLAVNEAMAHGLPVIAARGDGTVSDLIDHGKNGYILENQCSETEVLDALNWYIVASSTGEIVCGDEVRKQILERASIASMVTNFSEAIETTVTRNT